MHQLVHICDAIQRDDRHYSVNGRDVADAQRNCPRT